MWQRVQTLYLALSTALIALMFFTLKAVAVGADGEVTEEYSFTSNYVYLIFLIIITGLNLLALTSYKFRIFQMRTAMLAAIITLFFQLWLLVDFIFTHSVMVFKINSIFPIAAVIFDLLAYRGILSDQLVVESAYHLRKSRRDRKGSRKKS